MTEAHFSARDDLDFQAFRYIAGEMADAERVAFEAALAAELALGELTLSEAVARAVELPLTVQAAEKHAAVVATAQTRRAWQTRLSWLASGVLAGAAVIALAAPAMRWFAGDQAGAVADARTAKLAEVWSETAPLSELIDAEEDDVVADGHEIRPERVPSWMLAGLRGLADPETAADPMHDMTHPANDGELEN